jgi:hypothetical protein
VPVQQPKQKLLDAVKQAVEFEPYLKEESYKPKILKPTANRRSTEPTIRIREPLLELEADTMHETTFMSIARKYNIPQHQQQSNHRSEQTTMFQTEEFSLASIEYLRKHGLK